MIQFPLRSRARDFGGRELNVWVDQVTRRLGRVAGTTAATIGFPVENTESEFLEPGYIYGVGEDGAYALAVSALVAIPPFFLALVGGGNGVAAFGVAGGVFPVLMEDQTESISPGSVAWVSQNTPGTVTATKPTGQITRYAVGRFKDGLVELGQTNVLLNFDLRGA